MRMKYNAHDENIQTRTAQDIDGNAILYVNCRDTFRQFTKKQLMDMLDVSERTAARYIKEGDVPFLALKMIIMCEFGYLPDFPDCRILGGKIILANDVTVTPEQLMAITYVYQHNAAMQKTMLEQENKIKALTAMVPEPKGSNSQWQWNLEEFEDVNPELKHLQEAQEEITRLKLELERTKDAWATREHQSELWACAPRRLLNGLSFKEWEALNDADAYDFYHAPVTQEELETVKGKGRMQMRRYQQSSKEAAKARARHLQDEKMKDINVIRFKR